MTTRRCEIRELSTRAYVVFKGDWLTPDEAREMAAQLLMSAQEIERDEAKKKATEATPCK